MNACHPRLSFILTSSCNACNQLLMGAIINRCVRLGSDLFNHSKGLFFNRSLDRFSECQYNMSFHVQKVPDISNGYYSIKPQITRPHPQGRLSMAAE